MQKLSVISLLALVLVSAAACDEGDTTGGGVVCVEFRADQEPTPGEVTALMSSNTTCEAVIVELVVTDVDDVFGLQTMITYDTSIAQFSGWDTTDSILRSDGSEVASVVREVAAGTIEVGVTRVLQGGSDVTGTGTILELFFLINRNTEGSGDLTLEQQCLWGSEDPPQSKPDVDCSGGNLVVR
jgi:hypothetical protein